MASSDPTLLQTAARTEPSRRPLGADSLSTGASDRSDVAAATKRDILFVSFNMPPVVGGSATVYDQICRRNSTRIVALSSYIDYYTGTEKEGHAEYDANCGFPIHRIPLIRPLILKGGAASPLRRIFSLLQDVRISVQVLSAVSRLCRDYDVKTVCIGELIYGGWIGLYAKHVLRKNLVIYTHGEEISQDGRGFFSRRRGLFLNAADLVIAVSLFCKNQIISRLNVPAEKIKVVANGVDTERFSPGPKDVSLLEKHGLVGKKIILSAGRTVERKGFDKLIEALPAVIAEIPDAHCLILGDGPLRPTLKAMAEELGIADHVSFPGFVSEDMVPANFRLADVFAMPNRTMPDGDTEGFGLVFLEANACGKPVVSGFGGGATEAVIHGRSGLTVDGRNPAAIADAIVRILGDDVLRHRLTEGALQVAADATWQKRAEEFVRTVDEMASAPEAIAAAPAPLPRIAPEKGAETLPPSLLVTIDFEESFDWNKINRDAFSIGSIDSIRWSHEEFEKHGVFPVYVATYNMLRDKKAARFLNGVIENGTGEVGVHLHTWETPPYIEELSEQNSHQCNLPAHIERLKLESVCSAYRDVLGREPTIHRAGRFGIDLERLAMIQEFGIKIDLSLSPLFDFRREGGRDYRMAAAWPFWSGEDDGILCLPVSSLRFLRGTDWMTGLYYDMKPYLPLRGGIERVTRRFSSPVRLTPEGNSVERMQMMTDRLLKTGESIIVATLHSSSLYEGGNQYSWNPGSSKAICSRVVEFANWFKREHGGQMALPTDIHQRLKADRA
ncbi:MAG: hypothetical protein CMM50_03920 [Rhodospirillaceae bacterium]|nr:hypothetical protein [Rhodospirillaceae bacterium]